MSSNYTLYREDMKTGDCILWEGTTLISQMIKLVTRSKVSHASLILKLDQYNGLKDRIFTLDATAPGVDLRLLSKEMEEHGGNVWWCKLKQKYDPLRDRIAEWALCMVGTPYDFESVFRNLLGKVNSDAKRLFCSEYVAMAYKDAGVDLCCGKAPTPADLFNNYSEIFSDKIMIS